MIMYHDIVMRRISIDIILIVITFIFPIIRMVTNIINIIIINSIICMRRYHNISINRIAIVIGLSNGVRIIRIVSICLSLGISSRLWYYGCGYLRR
jgi:hypothetical protein